MLHYVASLAEKSNSELLTIPEDLAILEEASKTSLEQLSIEVTQLDNQIKKIANQMKQAQEDVKKQMSEFLDYASGVRYQFFILAFISHNGQDLLTIIQIPHFQ